MKTALICILATLVSVKGNGQQDLVKWGDDVKIKWSDFKGLPDVRSPFVAISAIGIYYKYYSVVCHNTP